jgi:hypothetical protein
LIPACGWLYLFFFASQKNKTRGASHFGLAIYIKEYLLKAKRRIRGTQIFQHAKV